MSAILLCDNAWLVRMKPITGASIILILDYQDMPNGNTRIKLIGSHSFIPAQNHRIIHLSELNCFEEKYICICIYSVNSGLFQLVGIQHKG